MYRKITGFEWLWMITRNLIGNDYCSEVKLSKNTLCWFGHPVYIRHGLQKGKGRCVVVLWFEVRAELERYDCIRVWNMYVTEKLVSQYVRYWKNKESFDIVHCPLN